MQKKSCLMARRGSQGQNPAKNYYDQLRKIICNKFPSLGFMIRHTSGGRGSDSDRFVVVFRNLKSTSTRELFSNQLAWDGAERTNCRFSRRILWNAFREWKLTHVDLYANSAFIRFYTQHGRGNNCSLSTPWTPSQAERMLRPFHATGPTSSFITIAWQAAIIFHISPWLAIIKKHFHVIS